MIYTKKNTLKTWAREFNGNFTLFEPKTIKEVQLIISKYKNIISSGGFRSYGDSAINSTIINSKNLNNIISFDEKRGILKAQSGVTVEKMINFLLIKGWFLKVTPGTKFATLGGCIASDVHGKEHHKEGCFSENLKTIKLIINKKKMIKINRTNQPKLFKSTCGGMGLTGFITEAEIKCKKITSSSIKYQKRINKNLDDVFTCFEKFQKLTYSVAWIDTINYKKDYRSVFLIGEFFKDSKFVLNKDFKIRIPIKIKLINNLVIKLFNNFYFYWNQINKKKGLTNYDSFFYPLDKIKDWYKLYGAKGFVQYQFIVPKTKSKKAIFEVLNFMNNNKFYSSLAVLKLHGKNNSNYLSFPLSGYSLAMDFPVQKKTYLYLKKIDEIVMKYDGKVYLTKDVRLEKNTFRKFYPKYFEIVSIRKKYKIFNFLSKQSKRLGLND